jgi:crotonobetainyl-CoA:carnitine CoA-transferase CaiB-like acyl-CoA transferase
MSALSGFRIVELAESVAGEYCGKLLADFGAEVIKVEAPGRGSRTRAMAPLVDGIEGSGLFAYLNTNKLSVELDVTSDELTQLIGTADAVIDDCPTDRAAQHPSVVFCSITPFGHGAALEFDNA